MDYMNGKGPLFNEWTEEDQQVTRENAKRSYQKPSLYDVVLVNDDITPMEFVVSVLCDVFHKSHIEAMDIVTTAHQEGEGHCGIYTYDVAETKMIQVVDIARLNNFPLKCIMVKQT